LPVQRRARGDDCRFIDFFFAERLVCSCGVFYVADNVGKPAKPKMRLNAEIRGGAVYCLLNNGGGFVKLF